MFLVAGEIPTRDDFCYAAGGSEAAHCLGRGAHPPLGPQHIVYRYMVVMPFYLKGMFLP